MSEPMLTPEVLADLDGWLSSPDLTPERVAALRQTLPSLRLRSCDAADVDEPPFRDYPNCALHLLDTRDHCVRLTRDPACATALLLAMRRPGSVR